MKLFKKLAITLSAAVLCLVPLLGPAITARAEGPVTYYVKYVESVSEWRFMTGTWQDGQYHQDLYALQQAIKDGDHLVIDGSTDLLLEVNVNLDTLTIAQSTCAVIHAKSINTFYAIGESVSAINGDVKQAIVYDKAVVNFNNNVDTLELSSPTYENLNQTVTVVGTVNHLKASGSKYVHFELYNFAQNSLCIEQGKLKTDSSKYSNVPVAASTPATTTPSAPSTSSSEYDDVPKTGDIRFNPLWLVAIAAVCFVGSYELKKRY